MLNKPFKPPLLKKSNNVNERQTDAPLVKRRRISKENEAGDASASFHKDEYRPHVPLNKTNPPRSARKPDDDGGDNFRGYYTVLWYLLPLYLRGTRKPPPDSDALLGGSLPPRSTNRGLAMAFWPYTLVMRIFRTSRAKSWAKVH